MDAEAPPGKSAVTGSCLCESVRFELTLPTQFCAHCHCSMCRRNHGAAFVTWVVALKARFRITAGDSLIVRYRSSEHGTRSFCSRCGSTLFCESTNHPERIDVVLANMHDAIDQEPGAHVYFDDRAQWVSVADALPKLGGKTGLEPLD